MPAPALRFEEPTFAPTFLESIENFIIVTCKRYRIKRAERADLVQEALTKIVANVGSFQSDKGDFDTWARGVALNVIRRHVRNAKRKQARFTDYCPNVHEYAAHEPSPEQCLQRKQARRALSNAMAKLTPQQANVVVCFGIEDMPHSEIGANLSISEDASHQCYKRALDRLACCVPTDLLSVVPLVVSRCDEPFSFNETRSPWFERSHYVGQLAALLMAFFCVSSLNSSTTHESTTGDAQVLDLAQNDAMYRYDELVVHRDVPSVKPEPAQMTSVRDVFTPTRAVDKPATIWQPSPLPPYKHTPRSADHHLRGR